MGLKMRVYKENMYNNYPRRILRRLILPGFKLSYHGIADWFLFSLFVLPSYFGIRLGFFDLTGLRFFEVLLLCCICKNSKLRRLFFDLIVECPNKIWIATYLMVVVYTNLIHPSIGTIFYWIMNGVVVLFCVTFLVKYEYGLIAFLNRIKAFTWILCLISPLQMITGTPPFAILDTLGKVSTTSRFGTVRIMGNCTVANGYAMYLMILFPLMCYDWKNRRIDFWKNRGLLILMVFNIFMTGSRLTIGTLLLGFFLCLINLSRNQFYNFIKVMIVIIPVTVMLIYCLKDTSFIQSLLRTFFSAIDEVLNTNYAVKYGADATTLYNSSYYRELLWKHTILGDWLNPLLGRGGNYKFGMYVEGYRIQSIDNFYVGQYITYAWPGVITWLLMSGSFLIQSIKNWIRRKSAFMAVISISIICYFISLWYLDQLQTFPFMMAIFGIEYAFLRESVE